MFDDNLQMLPYLMIVAVGSDNFILMFPLILHGYLELAPLFNDILSRKPNALIISSGFVKGYIDRAVHQRSQLIELKADIELYIGFYLIAVWFIGWSSLITIIMFWQIMRLRYMISAHTQAAFRRLDGKITSFTASPRCPSIARTLYLKLRGLISSMGEMPEQNAAGGAAAGGGGGFLSKCNIF